VKTRRRMIVVKHERRRSLAAIAVSLTLVAAISVVGCRPRSSAATNAPPCDSVYSRDPSPDGRFEIVVCRLPTRGALPGQSSDGPGVVRLQDSDGRVLKTAHVDMVQLMPDVEWSAARVTIPLIAEWDLPPQ
jgi:hypothetical protein